MKSSAPKANKSLAKSKIKQDMLLIHGVSEDGEAYDVIRRRDDSLELGQVRALKEGQPVHGEVVRLTPRKDTPLVYDVKVEVPDPSKPRPTDTLASPESVASLNGPAQVATEAYRQNWDLIWARSKRSKALN